MQKQISDYIEKCLSPFLCGYRKGFSTQNVFRVSKKTSTKCLKGVLPREARHLVKTSWRCPKDVLNANLKDNFVRHLEDTFARYIVDVLQKTS